LDRGEPLVGPGGLITRRVHAAATARVRAILPTLAVFVDASGAALCQSRKRGHLDVWAIVQRYGVVDEAQIVADVRRMVWWANRGDLLDDIDKSNEILNESRRKAFRHDCEEDVKYHYDRIAGVRHFAVDGFKEACA